MKLYLLTQDAVVGYDTYDSMVVAAPNEDAARRISPYGYVWSEERERWRYRNGSGGPDYASTWPAHISSVTVELIGTAVKGTKEGIILASFNAG